MKLFSVAVLAVAMGINASMSLNNDSEETSLSNLVNASEANAECQPFHVAHGRCLQGAQICVFDTEKIDCDPYSM